jgi:hypothetical protein
MAFIPDKLRRKQCSSANGHLRIRAVSGPYYLPLPPTHGRAAVRIRKEHWESACDDDCREVHPAISDFWMDLAPAGNSCVVTLPGAIHSNMPMNAAARDIF